MDQVYFSLQEIALYLGLSPKTIYTWVENGEIPAYKFGRVWRFSLPEVEQFIRACYNPIASEKVGGASMKKETHHA
jgi:excisionase family DNA binding protein